MAVKNSVQAIALTNIASSTLTTSYQAINPLGLTQACFLIRVMNSSTQAVTLSYDGVTDHEFILASSTLQIESQANSQPNNNIAKFAANTVIYVKGTAGTGNIYLSGYYQPTAN
jgi:hypothetical protein